MGTETTEKAGSLRERAIDRAIADDPTRFAEETLALLVATIGATCAALFADRGIDRGEPDLIVRIGEDFDQEALDWVRATWARQRRTLRAGDAVRGPVGSAIPLPEPEDPDPSLPFVVVFLGGVNEDAQAPPVVALGDLLWRAVAAVRRFVSGDVDEFLRSQTVQAVLKRQLEAQLHAHEWNVARVARLLGVTRQTVYSRMERLGISRLHVSKAPA